MLKFTPLKLLEKYILKIVGPIIRILNYQLTLRQKLKIVDLMIEIYKLRLRITVYNNQIMSICFRML